MQDYNLILLKVIDFIKEYDLVEPDEINSETLIDDHLGIAGDDAIDFMVAYSNRFNVAIDSFIYSKYFREEGGSLFSFLFSIWKNRKQVKKSEKYPLRVKDLVQGVLNGKIE